MWDLFTSAIYKNSPNSSSHDYYFKNSQSLFFKKNICKNTVSVLNHGKFQENTSSNIFASNQLEVSFWRMKTNPDYIAILRAISDKGTVKWVKWVLSGQQITV